MLLSHLAHFNLENDQLAGVDGGTVEDCVKSWVVDAWVAVVVQAPCFIVPTKLSYHCIVVAVYVMKVFLTCQAFQGGRWGCT